ncbi:MAG: prepilin peptidase [Clostridia bacterium]|nr:prepilin peptidase [Clostridia bacterium]
MLEIFLDAMVVLFGLIISPFMVGLVDMFCAEEKITFKSIYEKKRFDPKYATITPLMLLVLFIKFGLTYQFGIYGFLAIILIMDAFADIKAQIIPNGLNFVGFLAGAVLIYVTLIKDAMLGLDLLGGMITGAGIFGLIALFAYIVYKKEGMGLGDVKLMGMLGMFFGVFNTIQIFVLSFAIGAVASIFFIVTRIKKANDYMAFGPFIVIATFITMFLPYTIMFPNYLNFINSLCNLISIG